jgi:hypothetical protein
MLTMIKTGIKLDLITVDGAEAVPIDFWVCRKN